MHILFFIMPAPKLLNVALISTLLLAPCEIGHAQVAATARQNTLEANSVVRLGPNQNVIAADYGGRVVEVIQASRSLSLPVSPPRVDQFGNTWSVTVKNLGPHSIMITGSGGFRTVVTIGEVVHITSSALIYRIIR